MKAEGLSRSSYQTDDEEEDMSVRLECLTAYGIDAGDLERLRASGIYTCNDFLHTKMNLTGVIPQSELAKIYKAAVKLMNDFYPAGSDVLLKDKDKVTLGSSNEVIVKNLAFNYDKAQLKGLLKQYGKNVEVESVIEKGLFTGSAKALFQSSQDARKALALNGSMFFGRELKLEISGDDQKAELPFVVVKRLPRDITIQEVRAHFSKCGDSTKLDFSKVYHKKHRHAFIQYDSQDSIDIALSLNGSALRSQKITVELGRTDMSSKVSEGQSGSSSGPIRRSTRQSGRSAGGRPY